MGRQDGDEISFHMIHIVFEKDILFHVGNHIEMGLHVFFGCYYNLFGIMKRIGELQNLRLKEHTHTFINTGGKVGELVS